MKINEVLNWRIPDRPGTLPIPPGHVRLYHQTDRSNLGSIKHNGIRFSHARGIEGPKAIWADERGFYGKPTETPTVEFHVPQERWQPPFVQGDVDPADIIAVHHPWHERARYIEEDPKLIARIIQGDHDNLLSDPHYGRQIRYIKHKYGTVSEDIEPGNLQHDLEPAELLQDVPARPKDKDLKSIQP